MERAYIFSVLSYQYRKTHIFKNDKKWLVRTQSQLLKWIPRRSREWIYTNTKFLESEGFIERRRGLFYRRHSYFYHLPNPIESVPIHFNRFKKIHKELNYETDVALLFCILYQMFKIGSHEKIRGRLWICTPYQEFRHLINISDPTLRRLFRRLEEKGFIKLCISGCSISKNDHCHISIPDEILNKLNEEKSQVLTSEKNLPKEKPQAVPIRIIFRNNNNPQLPSLPFLENYKSQLFLKLQECTREIKKMREDYEKINVRLQPIVKYEKHREISTQEALICTLENKIESLQKQIKNNKLRKKRNKKYPIHLNKDGKLCNWQNRYIMGVIEKCKKSKKFPIHSLAALLKQFIIFLEKYSKKLDFFFAVNTFVKLHKTNKYRDYYNYPTATTPS